MARRRFLFDAASAIRCRTPSLRRQKRWDDCATLASSPSAACQSSDRLRALATMFVSILVALPQSNVCGVRASSRLVKVKFLQDDLSARSSRALPTTSNKAGQLKKHRTFCLISFFQCDLPPGWCELPGQFHQPRCNRQQDSCCNSGPVLREIRASLPSIWSPSFANGPLLTASSSDSCRTEPRINPGIPRTQDFKSVPLRWDGG